ncbi:N-alpha-acetyltransferase 40 [Tritrichomonas foetus]|uniref:N-alpha-acetyltransferase 40 n=1 Tax=Tritrichomonas foetus TaxID=1144522 RepID=A0A1J4J5D7_9EUKA|nr:N-alpha-acetyltransferase 40 [Tritrichomonas foetus]|eukprot:OHS94464.1 N-alpha-acetyltransferase 40 [Tritrichomonas foetus]
MTSKAALRRQKIKEETEMLNAKRKLIADAEAIEDLLADIPMFKKFDRNGLKATVTSYNGCPEDLQDWAFELTARHMKQYYENSWGWSDKNKRTELFEEHSRYLIATNEENQPIGFIHIRFELELKDTTCYVYELQVEDKYQRKGLGRFLMQAAEFIALKRKMESVMLTVFIDNAASRAFYKGMNYHLHPSTPFLADPEAATEYNYEILTKSLVKKA